MRNILSTSTNGKFFLQARSVGFESGGKGQTQTKILENQKKKKKEIGSKIMTFLIRNVIGVVLLFFLLLIV